MVSLGAGPAFAHNPVLLDESDTLPWAASLAPDGTVSMAFYDSLPHPGSVRSAQFTMRAGEPLHVEVLIPDLAPEDLLPKWALPRALLISPAGQVRVLRPTLREPFYEEFTRQNLLYLARYDATAQAGTYSVVVTGAGRSRFVPVTCQREVLVSRWSVSPRPRSGGTSNGALRRSQGSLAQFWARRLIALSPSRRLSGLSSG
jgi:hypothetical protein